MPIFVVVFVCGFFFGLAITKFFAIQNACIHPDPIMLSLIAKNHSLQKEIAQLRKKVLKKKNLQY